MESSDNDGNNKLLLKNFLNYILYIHFIKLKIIVFIDIKFKMVLLIFVF